MALAVDLFWSFRSPYSYLATPRLVALARDWDVAIAVRPVLPIALRDPDKVFANPLAPLYILRDAARTAEYLGLPLGWPRPDPVVQEFVTRRIAPEQPHAWRLTRLGVAAARAGRGLAFIDEVSRLLWSGTVDGWDQGDHLAAATRRAGLDLAQLESTIAREQAAIDAELDANHAALGAAGHWGVPTMVFQGEPFFGQDRIDLLVWRLRQHGLTARPAAQRLR
ncbi:MAG: DsbA family protein [Candidatus Binatia bacterium]